ncbi:MqnA/MqnD/SBP family protein [Clostridium sp.]|uniref:ABC transporter substrate-binding protein n=1 Tax=Clostridium sp. TaxID=1506 RepID=UPI001A44608C|nr:MqnA/MqnD/SBP family protein [Clostridium sp.]MBK5242290.1 ABC transporter substrate-binding protein [Clostridium sp.]
MKKVMALVVVLFIGFTGFTGCSKEEVGKKANIVALKGPTGMGMVKLMEDDELGKTKNDYTFSLSGAPDEVVGMITTGQVDIAAVPTNLAATLYKKTEGKIKIIANNTLGVLYIVTNGVEITKIDDLRGKKIYATGQGTTPEYVLNYVLEQNGLIVGKDVEVEYRAEHSEVATLMAAGEIEIALLPQPFVTSVLMQNKDVKIALDMTKEWETVSGENPSALVMGSIIVRTEFLEKNKAVVDSFLEEYAMSTEYVNNNIDESAALIEKFDIMKAAPAKIAIPKSSITFIDGSEMKSMTSGFLEVLFKANPKSVGGELPDEDFYYEGKK